MAQRKKRRRSSKRSTQQPAFPGWLWMLFGLALGLSVAYAVYVKNNGQPTAAERSTPQPASLQSELGNRPEPAAAATAPADTEKKERRFTFYDLLPKSEMQVQEKAERKEVDAAPTAVVEPGLYVLQAGSFSTANDADRRKAELALHGIESHVQRTNIDGKNYFRVYVGPTEDLDELNLLRSRLRAANIDVWRIRLGD